MLFEKDENKELKEKITFNDEDYTETNKNYQRVRNYSFARAHRY